MERLRGSVLLACQRFSQRALAKAAGVSLREVSAVLRGRWTPSRETLAKLYRAAPKLQEAEQTHAERRKALLAAVRRCCQTVTVRQFAMAAGVPYSHLSEALGGRRKASRGTLAKLEIALAQLPS
jgi:transcriptional regulator with XRE-family HTH domain